MKASFSIRSKAKRVRIVKKGRILNSREELLSWNKPESDMYIYCVFDSLSWEKGFLLVCSKEGVKQLSFEEQKWKPSAFKREVIGMYKL